MVSEEYQNWSLRNGKLDREVPFVKLDQDVFAQFSSLTQAPRGLPESDKIDTFSDPL